MSLIDGIGDEVLQFFVALFLLITIALAWWTTNTRRNEWQLRTVYVIERPLIRLQARFLSNHTEAATIAESTSPGDANDDNESDNSQETEITDENKPPEPSSSESSSQEEINEIEQEQNDILETMDADANVLRQRRLNFYENKQEKTNATTTSAEAKDETASTSNTERTENDNNETSANENIPVDSESQIRIKLKYINDDLRLVDGRLEELLGDFKRRHFRTELSANKLVKLIFNGQVLQRDNDTLQSCGMFDNCVVHCLVHQHRNNTADGENQNTSDQSNRRFNGRGFNNNNNNNNNRDWDLSNLLIATVSFSLGTAWYFRYQYPHLFTITATLALVAITGIFTVVSVGIYFPDPDPATPRVETVG